MHGDVSRIVPMLEPGAGVVTSRADVHYVVTEHGIAYLHGKTLRERAEALIAIADPRFQTGTGRFCGARPLSGARKTAAAFVVRMADCLQIGAANDGSRQSAIAACCGSMKTSARAAGCALRPARPRRSP